MRTAYILNSALTGKYYFSDEYSQMEADYLAQLEPLAQERAQLRYDALKGEADEKLGDAQADIDSAEAEILDAQTEIEENEATLADSEQEILDGEAALEEGKQALEDARIQIADQLSALGLDADFSVALT